MPPPIVWACGQRRLDNAFSAHRRFLPRCIFTQHTFGRSSIETQIVLNTDCHAVYEQYNKFDRSVEGVAAIAHYCCHTCPLRTTAAIFGHRPLKWWAVGLFGDIVPPEVTAASMAPCD